MSREHYTTLGVSNEATQDEIKRAYRKKAMQLHPDRNPDDPKAAENFKKISQAYEILSDPQKRQLYDRHGDEAFANAGGPQGSQFGSMEDILRSFREGFGPSGGESIFDFFSGGGPEGAERSARGASKKMRLDVSFADSFRGVEREIALPAWVPCANCRGSGAASPGAKRSCVQCGGTGEILQSRGFFSMASPCPRCRGEGSIISDPCKRCSGRGRMRERETVKLAIPAGIADGMQLRVAGRGDAPEGGGGRGDLFVQISVKPHEIFGREGDHLVVSLPLTFTESALGCKKDIATFRSTCKVTIPPGTQPGKHLLVRGEGFPSVYGRGKGNLIVKIQVEIPHKLTEHQRELLRQFASSETPDQYQQRSQWLEKFRVFFANSPDGHSSA